MSEPWNAKIDSERKANTLTNFVLFCEDQVSEPFYFKYFETILEGIKITTHIDQYNMHKNVLNAMFKCEESGIIKANGDLFEIEDGTNVWCVFDRDREETEEKVKKGNIEFDESIKSANSRGINVAWSNDCFELWVLLHFEDIPVEEIDRKYYYDRLTEIFKTLPDPNEAMQRLLQVPGNFNYKSSMKKRHNFLMIVRKELESRFTDAITRAKALAKIFEGQNLTNSQKAPMTRAHVLLDEILDAGTLIEA